MNDKHSPDIDDSTPSTTAGENLAGGGAQYARQRHGKGVSVWFVLGLLLTIGAVAYIIFDGAEDAVFAYTVDQAVGQKTDLVGKKFRVRGDVKEGTIVATPGTLESRFDLVKNDEIITIRYDKPLPDTFKAGMEVIAEGQMGSDGVLVADNIIAKCPSKYEEGAPTGKKMGGGMAQPADHPPTDSPTSAPNM